MASRTASYVEAIEQLPEGTMLVVPNATWDEYEELLLGNLLASSKLKGQTAALKAERQRIRDRSI